MSTVYLLLGGNLGDRMFYLHSAKNEIEKHIGTCIKQSSIYETVPWGFTHFNQFLNQLIVINSTLSPKEVMQAILNIEYSLGRVRENQQWKERTIDIDILFYDSLITQDPFLEIPHPLISKRRFALTPLVEIAPDYVHPVYDKTMSELLQICEDELAVIIYKNIPQHAL